MKKDLSEGAITKTILLFAGPMLLHSESGLIFAFAPLLMKIFVDSTETRIIQIGVPGIWWAIPIGWILADSVGLWRLLKWKRG